MPPKKSRKKLYFILAVLVVLGVSSFFFIRRNTDKLPDHSATVEKRTLRETIDLSGEVTADTYAKLHFPAGGLVTYYPWHEGDQIEKFSTVASLDQRALKKTLEKYLNTFVKERNDFDTTQDTYETDKQLGNLEPDIRRALEAAQYDLNSSVLDVELQDLSLKLSRLTSPIKGTLVSSPITTPNVYVTALDEWYIVDPESLTFTADLDESDLSKVEVGQTATIDLDAYPDMELETTVRDISYNSKLTTTGTVFEVTFGLPSQEVTKLRLGLNGNVSILKATYESVLTIPIESVKETADGTIVTVEENGKPVERSVKLGASSDMYYQVLDGLEDGEKIYY